MTDDKGEKWKAACASYEDLINDTERDSDYLRRKGLAPTVLELAGDTNGLVVLDAGSGTGWLLDEFPDATMYAFDINPEAGASRHENFSVQDIRALEYDDAMFDIVVANFILV